ncbi:hypothetical protein GCM10009804_68960 [Kribbella hippodromi]|uniref:Aminoglycoside phosphotransferase domain-containing protein n=1 Tax=Kribbella hippodromi TaxID=434347 RepID=A0ABP4Q799_9ACTN
MKLQPVERAPGAFQQSLTPPQIEAVCRRALGLEAVAAVELGLGGYNSVYRVDLRGRDEPVILRAAPEEAAQFGSERHLMRNEYATLPWLATIAPLLPRVLAVDWSHEVINRDWMIQTCLPGIPAPKHLDTYPRSGRTTFFRQLGTITRAVHAVRGPTSAESTARTINCLLAATLRLERHRLNNPQAVQSTYPEMAKLLTQLD